MSMDGVNTGVYTNPLGMITGVSVQINHEQIAHVNTVLQSAPQKALVVYRRAISRGLSAGRVQANKEIKTRYDISNAGLNNSGGHSYSTYHEDVREDGGGVVGRINFAGSKIPLYRFHPSPAARAYTTRYVNQISGWRVTTDVSAADVRGQMLRRRTAFIATMPSGRQRRNQGVLGIQRPGYAGLRTGAGSYPKQNGGHCFAENQSRTLAGFGLVKKGDGSPMDENNAMDGLNGEQTPEPSDENGAETSIDETVNSPESSIEETGNGDGGGAAEKTLLVYIGPSLIYEKLRSSQILSGTEAEIEAFMAPITEKYPEAVHLLVTPEELPEAMRKVESKNSVLHKYYQDMLAKSRDIRKG